MNLEQQLSPKYIGILAVVAAAILLLGILLKPQDQAAEPAVSQTELVRLRRLGQKALLENMSGYFAATAAEIASHVVGLQGTDVSGVIWESRGSIVTAASNARLPDTVVVITHDGMRIPANLVVAAPDLPMALLQAPVNWELLPSTTRPIDGLKMGESLLAVARQEGGNHIFLSGSYGGYAAASCGYFGYRRLLSSMSLSAAMLGGGVFDLDGNLIAVIVRCGALHVAMAAADAGSLLREGATLRGQMLRRYGFYAQPLDAITAAYYRTEEGVWISEVWKGFAAERAGLQPGDLLIAVAGTPLTDVSGLSPLVQPGATDAVELTVRRGARNVAITLARQAPPVSAATSTAAEDGIVLESSAPGYAVASVAAGSRAAAAGLRAGDRILRIGTASVSGPDALRRLLAAQRDIPTFVLVDRGNRLAGLFLR